MSLLFISLLMLAAGCFIYLVVNYYTVHKNTSMVIIVVKDQEPWVEGFIRKVFYLIRNTPWISIQVIDDGSCDCTLKILKRLQRRYYFELLCVKAGEIMELSGGANRFSNIKQYDVRGLTGKDLLRAPLFFRLSADGAGNFNALSK
ncbi:MAG: hypothetical protein A4E52_01617 [Pelotomaculum sp. PtaB.Bin013]|uniref:Uncharacterized protein n=1 Tax=Pelotomaculum isophthalicicum JI TaxID=947010 RepID=A0A9X4H0S1_9FIRM|nr:hypothetical protein [Pelotomaculum isophthalicicum]MDF9406976.1 hypothetical protein [Pelotomaculum isophthalicicum JI]OPX85733.1 MAG: hypothetical protein A4E52_01617 [Pelotomaculum sp. PtaB.Bin013]